MKTLILLISFFCLATFSSTARDTLKTIPSEYVYSFHFSELAVDTSECYFVLSKKLEENNFIVIGETHGVHESTTLINEIAQAKTFNRLITEIDQFSVDHLTQNFKKRDEYLKKMPGVYAMYSYLEEAELLQTIMASKAEINGIDLIHPSSVRLILFQMAMDVNLPSKSVKKIQELIERHTKDLSNGFLSKKTRQKTRKLLHELANVLSSEGEVLVTLLHHNQYPVEMMKGRAEYMTSQLEELEKGIGFYKENVLFKFGSSHVLKTKNTAGYKDVGRHIHTLEKEGKVEAFFLGIIPVSGVTGLPFFINDTQEKPYNFHLPVYTELRNLYMQINQTNTNLFVDVEAFRSKVDQQTILSKDLKKILRNYDALIFLKEVHPSCVY